MDPTTEVEVDQKKMTKSLSLLVFALGSGRALADEAPARVQAMQVLNEKKISYEEFLKAVAVKAELTDGIGSYVSAGNYGNYISEGNYANYVSAGNYADYISAGNYANYISAGSYGKVGDDSVDAGEIPSPKR